MSNKTQTDIIKDALDLAGPAVEQFAEDIAMMFDASVSAKEGEKSNGQIGQLRRKYRKIVAFCGVKCEGVMSGEFFFLFDKEALFALGGTFVMLPEKIIEQNMRGGTLATAKENEDAFAEVGNLLVGSLDKMFRTDMDGHGHFSRSKIILANNWAECLEEAGLGAEVEAEMIDFNVRLESLEEFKCSAVFPLSIFGEAEAEVEETVEEKPKAEEKPKTEKTAKVEKKPEVVEKKAEVKKEEAKVEKAEAKEEVKADAKVEAKAEAELESSVKEEVVAEEQVAVAVESGPISQAISSLIHRGGSGGVDLAGLSFMEKLAVDSVMDLNVVWAEENDTVEDVLSKMQSSNTGYVFVGNGQKISGLVSKSDIRGAMSPYLQSMFAKWKRPLDIATLQIKVKWIMSRPVRTIRMGNSLASAVRAMCEHGGRCVPVVDEKGQAVGIVTAFDVFNVLLNLSADGLEGKAGQNPPLG